jgi:protein-S-isoprenylcysteine O-methyltransferase Ste14
VKRDFSDRPNRIPWPPLIYIGCALVAVLINRAWPLAAESAALKWIGGLLLVVAIAIELWSFATFRKHQTTIMPNKGAAHLISDGPFRFSRNPIYVANTILVTGAALFFDDLWLIPAAFIAALLTQELAIKREEKHLALKFSQAWKDYTAKVSRWI